ncbi:MAG: AI-2E family transporter [Halorhodospira sp.]
MSYRARIWLAMAAALLGGLYLLSSILFPFVLGMVIAYMLDPVCDRLQARGIPRTAATALLLGGFLLAAVAALAVAVPLLWSQAVQLIERAPELHQRAQEAIEPLWADLAPYLSEPVRTRIEQTASAYAGTAAGWLGSALQAIFSGSLAAFDLLSMALITPLVAFYLIRDWNTLLAEVDRRIPRPAVAIVRARAREIDATLAAWMRGVATVAGILAAFYTVSLSAIGLSYSVLIGLFAGAISFIPFVGAIVGGLLAFISALFSFDTPTMWLLTVGIFLLGQVVESNFLTPRLVGRNVELHEVWVIFSLMAGGLLFGFTGVLLAIPVTASIGVLVRAADDYYLGSRLYDPQAGGDGASGAD